MLRFAVCDDEEDQCRQIAALLKNYLDSHSDLQGQVMTFCSGDALLAQAEEQGGFDLYILDILMPELNGIDTGRQLRALGDGGRLSI